MSTFGFMTASVPQPVLSDRHILHAGLCTQCTRAAQAFKRVDGMFILSEQVLETECINFFIAQLPINLAVKVPTIVLQNCLYLASPPILGPADPPGGVF